MRTLRVGHGTSLAEFLIFWKDLSSSFRSPAETIFRTAA